MMTRSRPRLARLLIGACLFVAVGCESSTEPGGVTGGGADIDITSSTPASGNTNISGAGVTVSRSSDMLSGVAVTRITVDATTDGLLRRVIVYFKTSDGAVQAVSYLWGSVNVSENVVYCPAMGCSGVTVDQGAKEITFLNTALDDNNPVGPTTVFATLSLGAIQYQ
jgi:hypothetical protein